MRMFRWVIFLLFTTFVTCAMALPEDAEKVRIMDGVGKAIFVVFGLMLLGYLWRLCRWRRRSPATTAPTELTGRRVIVDGSNVMHWGGEPSIKILARVLEELRKRNLQPLVYFDANVGYKLFNRYIRSGELARQLDLPVDHVTFAPSKTPADEVQLGSVDNHHDAMSAAARFQLAA